MGKQMAEVAAFVRNAGFDYMFAYDGSDRQEYVGAAFPGALTSEAKWQIIKMSYTASSQQSVIRHANGSDDFRFVWDDRASYTYLGIS